MYSTTSDLDPFDRMELLERRLDRVKATLRSLERGEHATKGRDFGRGVAYVAKKIRESLDD